MKYFLNIDGFIFLGQVLKGSIEEGRDMDFVFERYQFNWGELFLFVFRFYLYLFVSDLEIFINCLKIIIYYSIFFIVKKIFYNYFFKYMDLEYYYMYNIEE